jgi:hypothetical protein
VAVRDLGRRDDMRKFIVPSIAAGAAVVVTLAVTSMTSKAADTSYAEDRAAIEDLQARYLFAMDFGDPDLYVTTFTEDGILDVGSGEIKGRKAIRDVIAKMRYSTGTVTMRTSSSRSTASGSSRSGGFTTKVAPSGLTKVVAIRPGKGGS